MTITFIKDWNTYKAGESITLAADIETELVLQGLAIRLEAQHRAISKATISAGSSVSATIMVGDAVILAIIMPAAWTTAALNLEVSADGTTWVAPLDSTGMAVCSFTVPVVSAGYAMDLPSLMPWRYARLRSGTSATSVNQAADRVFQVVTRSLA